MLCILSIINVSLLTRRGHSTIILLSVSTHKLVDKFAQVQCITSIKTQLRSQSVKFRQSKLELPPGNNIILQVAALAPLALLLVYDARFACISVVHRKGNTYLTVKL